MLHSPLGLSAMCFGAARFWLLVSVVLSLVLVCQTALTQEVTEQQKLRGSITPERQWWDLQHYDLSIEVFPETKSLHGTNRITFVAVEPSQRMQIDLQPPLLVESVTQDGEPVEFERNENVTWVTLGKPMKVGEKSSIVVEYGGVPVESKNPPWSGGLTWTQDDQGKPFIATSCQGIGASIWWPCKDHLYDEPDLGMDIRVTVPHELTAVSNGRLIETTADSEASTRTFHWRVKNPINNYAVNMNIGNYVNFSDVYEGEFGKLDLDYWVLENQRETAETHFKEAPRTIEAFEHWFGKYPFYEDSYKLVVVPYLGMEHQSSVTYGNGFKNGYRGRDLSNTGVGLKFDFIIVHESGHEWFGNNISMRDVADMWIHESFTNYSENLFVNYHFTQQEAEDYVIGCRRLVNNDKPIIGPYDVNQTGSSGDMYYKGGNILHTLRQIVNDDEKWRQILRGLNREFWHQTVTTAQVEDYLESQVGIDLKPFFEQYLRTTDIPELIYSIDGNQVGYRFGKGVKGLSFPVKLLINGEAVRVTPTAAEQQLTWKSPVKTVAVDRNFYVDARKE